MTNSLGGGPAPKQIARDSSRGKDVVYVSVDGKNITSPTNIVSDLSCAKHETEVEETPPKEELVTKSSQSIGGDDMQLVKGAAFEMGFEGWVGVRLAEIRSGRA